MPNQLSITSQKVHTAISKFADKTVHVCVSVGIRIFGTAPQKSSLQNIYYKIVLFQNMIAIIHLLK